MCVHLTTVQSRDRLPEASRTVTGSPGPRPEIVRFAETVMNKGQTLVKMLELMTRRGGVRGTELVERFDLDARTLRRYLADLKELDIPIQDDGRSDDRVIAVDPRWKRTGVQLSLTEVLSLHFGRTLFN